MNNKKKICIGIIIILIVVIVVCLGKAFFNNKQMKVSNENKIIEDTNTNKILEENTITENEVDEENVLINADTESIENTLNTAQITDEKETSSETLQASTITTTSKTTPTQVQQQTKTTPQTNVEEPKVVEAPTQIISQVPIQIADVTQEKNDTVIKQEENTKEEPKTETKDEELYVINEAMINQIKQVIESNASENMITYGYEIVVDSSIKNLTNQFTYTENRVKSAISSKFGTIRIYAEDYYRNGQLIMTECYII